LGLYDTFGDESKKYLTVEVAARARAARVADAKSKNPEFNASAAEMMGSPGTTGLYLTTLWDDKAGAAPKSWVRAFFGMFCFFLSFDFWGLNANDSQSKSASPTWRATDLLWSRGRLPMSPQWWRGLWLWMYRYRPSLYPVLIYPMSSEFKK
jgi:hypothetical protein